MFITGTPLEHRSVLSGIAHCSNCGALMTVAGTNYACPANIEGGAEHCSTTPIDAGRLVGQVVAQLVKRVMTDSTIALLTNDIQETASAKSRMQKERLQTSESSIEGLNSRKEKLLRPVEQGLAKYPDVAGEINDINATSMGLSYESKIARDEIDKLAFISDREGLREDARDIATYIDHADPEETRELVNIFIQDIHVGPRWTEIFYSHPMPDKQDRARITSDLIKPDRDTNQTQ